MFNILILLVVAAISAVVFVLLTGFSMPRTSKPTIPEDTLAEPALGLSVLIPIAEGLLARYGIDVETRVESGPGEVTMVGTSDDPLVGGRYIVACRGCPEGEVVPSTRLLEFRDEVKASGATKGVFLTDGYFTSDARYLLEDAPVSLINRQELTELSDRLGPGFLSG